MAAGAVFQPRWWAGVCPDRLADHAAAPGDSSHGALGCVQPGGSDARAAGAVRVVDVAAGSWLGVGMVALAIPKKVMRLGIFLAKPVKHRSRKEPIDYVLR